MKTGRERQVLYLVNADFSGFWKLLRRVLCVRSYGFTEFFFVFNLLFGDVVAPFIFRGLITPSEVVLPWD